ncbi:MAG: hypothetical protein K2X46_05725 [Roseomonas sp.]|nr:hypothetical protein [Roseomonas sp.]
MDEARARPLAGGLITLGLVAAGAAVIGLIMLAGHSPRADYQAMRAHALSRLTDADLRRIDAEARAGYARDYAAGEVADREARRRRVEERRGCDDPAVRLRNPNGCTMSLFEFEPFDPIIASVPQRIEMAILGVCALGPFTVREARRLRCLP